ncbi:MAG: hypothetical protein AB7R77_06030 [Ilumatobacteraceae bacterium]
MTLTTEPTSARPDGDGTALTQAHSELAAARDALRELGARIDVLERRAFGEPWSPLEEFVDAFRGYVDELRVRAQRGVDAYHAGDHETAESTLQSIETDIGDAVDQIGEGNVAEHDAIRYSDSNLGLSELVPELTLLAGLVAEGVAP